MQLSNWRTTLPLKFLEEAMNQSQDESIFLSFRQVGPINTSGLLKIVMII